MMQVCTLKMAVCPFLVQVLLPKGEHLNNDVSAKVCVKSCLQIKLKYS